MQWASIYSFCRRKTHIYIKMTSTWVTKWVEKPPKEHVKLISESLGWARMRIDVFLYSKILPSNKLVNLQLWDIGLFHGNRLVVHADLSTSLMHAVADPRFSIELNHHPTRPFCVIIVKLVSTVASQCNQKFHGIWTTSKRYFWTTTKWGWGGGEAPYGRSTTGCTYTFDKQTVTYCCIILLYLFCQYWYSSPDLSVVY